MPTPSNNSPLVNSIGRFTKQTQGQQPQNPVSNSSSNLIRNFNDQQQSQWQNSLEIPKVQAPKLQEAAPRQDSEFKVTTPQAPSLQQMTAPIDSRPMTTPQYDVTAEFNQRLMQQIPTLYSGEPSDSQRRTNSFYDWLDGTIENNRKNEYAQAKMQQQLQNLAASNTTPGQRPNGFLSNVGKLLFGGEDKTDDGVLGNEFDLKKLRFGQYGNGVVGGLMYGVDQTFGLGIIRNSLLDVGAGLSSQAAGLFANGGLFSTLFKTGDVGQAIVAGDNRYKQAMRNIYGDKYTPFYLQGLQGRDLGALGNLSGDSKDDYYKMYGSSPIAAGLDKAFFGRELTEQESKDYEKLTGYSIKQAAGLEFSQKEIDDYNEILGRTPEDFKVKMMIRNAIGLASDISGDEYIKKAGTMARGAIERGAFERALRNTLKGSEELPNEVPRVTSGSTEGLAGLLKAGDEVSTPERPLSLYEPPKRTPSEVTTPERRALKAPIIYEEPVVKGSVVDVAPNAIPTRASVPRGNNPWVTLDTPASRVVEAPAPQPRAVERQLSLSGIPETPQATAQSQLTQSLLKDLRTSETTSQQLALPSSSSGSKAMIASPVDVQTPRTPDVASILADQYKRQVTPGQYILQDLRTRASNDPLIQAKLVEPPAVIEKTVPFDTTKVEAPAVAKTTDNPKAFASTPEVDVVKTIPSSVDELKEVRTQSKEELLKKAREFLERQKKGVVETPKVEEVAKPIESTKPPTVEPVRSSATEGSVDWKKQQLAAAKERLQAEKASKQQTTLTPVDAVAQMAVEAKAATPVQGGAELRVDVNKVEGAALLDEAVDLHSIFTKEYSIDDLDELMSLAARKAAGAPISFVGKVAPISEVSRSQKEIYRFASLVPHPNDATKPLLPPTRSIVAEYEAAYGVEHPFKAYAIQDGSMRNLTKRGGVRKHKSLEDLAAEQFNPLYRKILSPGSNPIPLQIIERFEQQYATSGKGLVRTSPDTVAQVAPTKQPTAEAPVSVLLKRNDAIAELEKRGITNVKKNLSAIKLNDIIKHLDNGGDVTALDQSLFKKAAEVKQSIAKPPTPVAAAVEEPREKKIETAAKKVVSSQTVDEFEDAATKLEDLEPSLEELYKIEKKLEKKLGRRSAPIYDHRKKITSPAHNEGVDVQALRNPEVAAKQQEHDNLTQQLKEVVLQEQKLQEAKIALDVAVDNVEAQQLARLNKYMEKYSMTRSVSSDFADVLDDLIAKADMPPNSLHNGVWRKSKKYKDADLVEINFKDVWGSNLEASRQASIDSGQYEKAAAYFFNDPLHKPLPPKATNPVIKITRDGNFEFVSGRGTFFVMRDAGMESIPAQIVEDLRESYPLMNAEQSTRQTQKELDDLSSNVSQGATPNTTTSLIKREELSSQNIADAIDYYNKKVKPLIGSVEDTTLSVPQRRDVKAAIPASTRDAMKTFVNSIAELRNNGGTMTPEIQIGLNNAVLAMEKYSKETPNALFDFSQQKPTQTSVPEIAKEMREVVRRATGRTANEGQAFMPSAVDLLNDNTKMWSRDEIADLVSYAVGAKDVRFAANLTDDEVLKFGRMIAAHPETMSRFDNLYVGHGTGVVEYGTWSLEARPQTGQRKRELIQHVIDREFPKGTEVGVAACETSCPKRIQDAVPLLHRVVSRGEAASAIERVQRGLEQLSDVPVNTKLQDFFASYEGMLREAMSANKERGLQIVQRMSELETEFEKVNSAALNAKRQRASELMRLEDARMSVEKELLNGDC